MDVLLAGLQVRQLVFKPAFVIVTRVVVMAAPLVLGDGGFHRGTDSGEVVDQRLLDCDDVTVSGTAALEFHAGSDIYGRCVLSVFYRVGRDANHRNHADANS